MSGIFFRSLLKQIEVSTFAHPSDECPHRLRLTVAMHPCMLPVQQLAPPKKKKKQPHVVFPLAANPKEARPKLILLSSCRKSLLYRVHLLGGFAASGAHKRRQGRAKRPWTLHPPAVLDYRLASAVGNGSFKNTTDVIFTVVITGWAGLGPVPKLLASLIGLKLVGL